MDLRDIVSQSQESMANAKIPAGDTPAGVHTFRIIIGEKTPKKKVWKTADGEDRHSLNFNVVAESDTYKYKPVSISMPLDGEVATKKGGSYPLVKGTSNLLLALGFSAEDVIAIIESARNAEVDTVVDLVDSDGEAVDLNQRLFVADLSFSEKGFSRFRDFSAANTGETE